MHEFSLANQIMESVLEFPQAERVSEVLKVRVQIGELTCVEAEQLAFCYNSITRETLLEKSRLEIEPLKAAVRCSHCRYSGPPKYSKSALAGKPMTAVQCPACGKNAEVTQGHECAIKTVQFIGAGSSATHDEQFFK